jgi:hypothetical protein
VKKPKKPGSRSLARNYRASDEKMWHIRVYLSRYYIDWVRNRARRHYTITMLGTPRVGLVLSALIRDAIDRQVEEKWRRRGGAAELAKFKEGE